MIRSSWIRCRFYVQRSFEYTDRFDTPMRDREYTNLRFTLINFDRSSETNGSLIVQWLLRLSWFRFVLHLLWLTLLCEWKRLNDSIISGEVQYLLKIYLSNKSCGMCMYVCMCDTSVHHSCHVQRKTAILKNFKSSWFHLNFISISTKLVRYNCFYDSNDFLIIQWLIFE